MALDAQSVVTAGSALAVAASGVLYRQSSRTGRTLRRARARIEAHERYGRKLRRMLDELGADESSYAYPSALLYLTGAPDPDEDVT